MRRSLCVPGRKLNTRVIDIKVNPVTLRVAAPLRWSMGVETGTTRGNIELFTTEGILGIGETYGGNSVEHAIATAKPPSLPVF
jgi:hypothetical protein